MIETAKIQSKPACTSGCRQTNSADRFGEFIHHFRPQLAQAGFWHRNAFKRDVENVGILKR